MHCKARKIAGRAPRKTGQLQMIELPTEVQVRVLPPPFPSVVVVIYVPEPTLVVTEFAIAPPATRRLRIKLAVTVFIWISIR